MASRKEIAAEQQRLKDAGHYKGPVDGVDGPGTRDARAAYQRASDMAGANKAQAEAQRADAEARSAEARVKAIEAEAKAAKQKSDAENAGVNRATQVAMNVGAAAAGVGIGHAVAAKIERRQLATMEARATEAKAIGAEARKVVGKGVKPGAAGAGQVAKLQGVVAASNKLGIGQVKGPKGLAAAGVLLAEAAISRFVIAPQLENETAREAVNAVSTLGVFGATTILGERAVANATPKNLPAGKDLVAIEQARAIVNAKDTPKIDPDVAKAPKVNAPKVKALPKPSALSKVTQGAGQIAKGAVKYALPIVAGIAGATTFAKTGSAAEAGKAAGDVVTSGGVSYYDQARSAGMSKPRAVAEGVVRGAYSMATFGIFDKKLTVPGSAQAKAEKVRARVGNFPRQVQSQGRADFRNGLLEIAGGQRINNANPNPADRARQRVRMGIEAAPLTRGLSDAQSANRDEMFSHAVRGGASLGIASMAMDHAREAKGKLGRYGWRGAAALLAVNAADHAYQIVKARPSGGLTDAQKRDYAKASARKTSERQSAKPVKSDGMTDAYVRTQNGKTVQVGGYRTVLPK